MYTENHSYMHARTISQYATPIHKKGYWENHVIHSAHPLTHNHRTRGLLVRVECIELVSNWLGYLLNVELTVATTRTSLYTQNIDICVHFMRARKENRVYLVKQTAAPADGWDAMWVSGGAASTSRALCGGRSFRSYLPSRRASKVKCKHPLTHRDWPPSPRLRPFSPRTQTYVRISWWWCEHMRFAAACCWGDAMRRCDCVAVSRTYIWVGFFLSVARPFSASTQLLRCDLSVGVMATLWLTRAMEFGAFSSSSAINRVQILMFDRAVRAWRASASALGASTVLCRGPVCLNGVKSSAESVVSHSGSISVWAVRLIQFVCSIAQHFCHSNCNWFHTLISCPNLILQNYTFTYIFS